MHDTTAHAACKVTERLLDAVVPVVALSQRVVSWLRYEMHSGAKIQMFDETRRNRQTLWGGRTDANPKLLLNDT